MQATASETSAARDAADRRALRAKLGTGGAPLALLPNKGTRCLLVKILEARHPVPVGHVVIAIHTDTRCKHPYTSVPLGRN